MCICMLHDNSNNLVLELPRYISRLRWRSFCLFSELKDYQFWHHLSYFLMNRFLWYSFCGKSGTLIVVPLKFEKYIPPLKVPKFWSQLIFTIWICYFNLNVQNLFLPLVMNPFVIKFLQRIPKSCLSTTYCLIKSISNLGHPF